MVDSLIGTFVKTVEEQGLRDKTIFLITADHGGLGTSHGGPSKQELEIPWILNGPGVNRGKELKQFINTFDTAPTLAWILGINAPKAWIGKPVLEAFDSSIQHEQKGSYGSANSAALLTR